MKSLYPNRSTALVQLARSTLFAGFLMGTVGAFAETSAATANPGALIATQVALQGVVNGVPSDTVQTATAAEGYDWSLGIALGFGIIGLVWMRRHVANL